MNLDDLMPGGHAPRPEHPDFWRISEVCLSLKADVNEARTAEELDALWKQRVGEIGDFESINYHAIQVALQIMGVETKFEWELIRQDSVLRERFVELLQAFYDGFIIGANYEKRGGHQDA